MIFGDKNLTIIYPNKTQDVYDVSTTGGGEMTLTKDDLKVNVAVNELANLKHTIAMGLSTFGPNHMLLLHSVKVLSLTEPFL